MSEQNLDLSRLSKSAIIAELMTIKSQLERARLDLAASQLVSAARFDCLAMVASKLTTPDLDVAFCVPNSTAERTVMVKEIRRVVEHLRIRASGMESTAEQIEAL